MRMLWPRAAADRAGVCTQVRAHWVACACAWLALAGSSGAAAQSSRAAACAHAGQPFITVAFGGAAWTHELESAVLAELRAGLRLRGIEACTLGSESGEPPLALLELHAMAENRVAVGITLHDAITEKRVQRDVDVHEVSADARALAIAAAADELLRASWAELALSDAPAPARTPPPEVEHAVDSSLAPARTQRRDRVLGARAAIEHHTGGVTWLGGDGYAGLWPDDRIGVELAFGVREGLRRSARSGAVETHAVGGALHLVLALTPRKAALAVACKLGAALSSVRMRGVDEARMTIARAGAGWDAHVHAGVVGSLALSPAFALRAEVGAGLPLRSVAAVDVGRVVVSTRGLQLLSALGAEVRF
jgi:hypothetical protein